MPELPEVETARRGIEPHLLHSMVARVVVRERRLRWPVPSAIAREMPGNPVSAIDRRGKYLLLRTGAGTAILHLGMSGSLRVLDATVPSGKHDHVDIVFDNGHCLRLRDPRRFGALLWTRADPLKHRLLRALGPEPLTDEFDAAYLYRAARGRRAPVKALIMDSHVVVGVGNIYANEALFQAGIHPLRAAGRISEPRIAALVAAIKAVLARAIAKGGTTLRDFTRDDGSPGYFRIELKAYGREGEPCFNCGRPLRGIVIAQRATCYCTHCQR
jgi:formamidopyrimidine-DNA glycosylase